MFHCDVGQTKHTDPYAFSFDLEVSELKLGLSVSKTGSSPHPPVGFYWPLQDGFTVAGLFCLCICVICGVCFVIICSASLLLFGASGRLCFMIVVFPEYLYMYLILKKYTVLKVQGALCNTSRYPYLNISDLQNCRKNISKNNILQANM